MSLLTLTVKSGLPVKFFVCNLLENKLNYDRFVDLNILTMCTWMYKSSKWQYFSFTKYIFVLSMSLWLYCLPFGKSYGGLYQTDKLACISLYRL